ncbi:MAG: hypothetical protein KDJ75_00185 [Alphaproteobacteria bacterium]|nr:hypothetical protein [Alphaproteobacteria bacterium]
MKNAIDKINETGADQALSEETFSEENKQPEKKRIFRMLKKPGKNLFWAWIAYQAVKGSLTTSLIWFPLLYAWLHHQ